MHLNQIDLSVGDIITAGTIIGTVGTTGSACSQASNGAHLHLEVLIGGIIAKTHGTDPEPYLYTTFDSNGAIIRSCNN